MAKAERDPSLATVYRRLADPEVRHGLGGTTAVAAASWLGGAALAAAAVTNLGRFALRAVTFGPSRDLGPSPASWA